VDWAVSDMILYMDKKIQHWSDCALHNEPAYMAGSCDCGGVTVLRRISKTFYRLGYNLVGLLGMFHLKWIRTAYRLDDIAPTPATLLYYANRLFAKPQAFLYSLKKSHKYEAGQALDSSYKKIRDTSF
jgi:hypothetical protein